MKLSDFATRQEAIDYVQTNPKLIHRDTMNSLLASANMYLAFKQLSATNDNIAAFMDSEEFNFMVGNATGDRQIAALDAMIAVNDATGQALAAIKPVILAIANPTTKPFENHTLHDWEKAKGTIAYAQVAPVNGILTIATTADCEKHNPQVSAVIEGYRKRLAGFTGVEKAGEYKIEVPRGYPTVDIENAYGVIGA